MKISCLLSIKRHILYFLFIITQCNVKKVAATHKVNNNKNAVLFKDEIHFVHLFFCTKIKHYILKRTFLSSNNKHHTQIIKGMNN